MLLVAFLLVNAPNYHLSLVLASVVQGDAVNCNTTKNDQVAFLTHSSVCIAMRKTVMMQHCCVLT